MNIHNLTKSELKDYVHTNGYFSQAIMNKIDRNDVSSLPVENATQVTDSIPTGDNIFIYNGLVSQRYGKGEKNRNGYKISPDGWNTDEYMFNPAVFLMHDPDKGVIGNTVRLRVTEEGLNALFRVDVNNISDTGIRNQIMTGTLRATSTGSMVEEYEYEDMEGNSMSEQKAEEEYGERELFLAHFGASDKLILNITKSSLLELSMVAIGSNHKAVNSDTMQNYFINKLSNKMGLSKEQLQDKLNAVDTTEKEVETPQGIEAVASENDVVETPVSENDTEEVVTDEAPVAEEVETEEEVVEEPVVDTALQDALAKIEELQNKVASLENEINTPVTKNTIAKVAPAKTDKEIQKDFLANMWSARS